MSAIMQVLREYNRATKKFGKFNSMHEGISVIREEYLELEKEVFWGIGGRTIDCEAIQLAAMVIRFLVDCCGFELEDQK